MALTGQRHGANAEEMTRKRTWLAAAGTVAGVAAIGLAIPRFVATAEPPAPVAPALVCTLAAAVSADVGFSADPLTTSNAKLTIAPTTAACVDNRKDAKSKIIGAAVTAPEPGTLKGNCLKFKGLATIEFAWITTPPADEPAVSTMAIAVNLDGALTSEATVTGGPVDGYSVGQAPVDPAAANIIKGLIGAACQTEEGATQAVLAFNVFFNAPPE
jgi:hypothetical protein